MPGWVGPVSALSLVVIALAFACIAVGLLLAVRAVRQELGAVSDKLDGIRGDLQEAMRAVRRVAETGAELSDQVKEELQHYLGTGRAIREDLERGRRRIKRRLADLDALYEVVHEEVEETALDVAAKVRAVRQGAGMVSRLRRWLVRGRR